MKEIVFFTRLYVGLSFLRELKFKHSFFDVLNPISPRESDFKSLSHFFLHCSLVNSERQVLLHKVGNINKAILNRPMIA